MKTFRLLLNLACGTPLPPEEAGRARRLQLTFAALLMAVIFAAVWGLAAGSRASRLALDDLYKVPMVVLLSAACALPAGLLAWRFSGSRLTGSQITLAFSVGVFGGTLVMAVLAPVTAIYYHTSNWVGWALAMGSCWLGLSVGTVMFARAALCQLPPGAAKAPLALPVGVLMILLVASMLQFIHAAHPILPEQTVFDGGIDRLLAH